MKNSNKVNIKINDEYFCIHQNEFWYFKNMLNDIIQYYKTHNNKLKNVIIKVPGTGKYKIINSESEKIEIKDLQAPLLLPLNKKVSPSFEMCHDIEKDQNRLLNISLTFYQQKKISAWENILPIYPTSPVQKIQ